MRRLGGLDRGLEFIVGTELVIVHDSYDSTVYGTKSRDGGNDETLPQAVMKIYKKHAAP